MKKENLLHFSVTCCVDREELEPVIMGDVPLIILASLYHQWSNKYIIYRKSYSLPTNPKHSASKTSSLGLDSSVTQQVHSHCNPSIAFPAYIDRKPTWSRNLFFFFPHILVSTRQNLLLYLLINSKKLFLTFKPLYLKSLYRMSQFPFPFSIHPHLCPNSET